MIKKLNFDGEWFALIRTIFIILAVILIAMADQRYFTKKEAAQMELRINHEFDKQEILISGNADNYSQVIARLSRIEAQNEIILDLLKPD